MDGTAGRQLTAQWLLDGDGRCGGSSMAIERETAQSQRQWRWTAMTAVMDNDGRQWTARWRLDGDVRHDGSSAAMDGDGWCERDADGL